ncbi:MAG: arylesterase [Pseudomonadales bacterium]|nr:arylesterase [Gammaproteobacteria bacterium]NNL56889.1 arylesterase [Pseudomonadales bacterium]
MPASSIAHRSPVFAAGARAVARLQRYGLRSLAYWLLACLPCAALASNPGSAPEQAPQPAAAVKPVILVLGDSLSAGYGLTAAQGWVSLLQDWLQQQDRNYNIVNISISGETTSGGLARLPAALARWQPAVVIVALGGNDGLRAAPLPLVEDNLNKIIELCRAYAAKIVLAGMHIPPNYGPRYADAFFAIYARLAQQQSLPLVPFLLDGVATNPALMQDDGLHPNANAQPRIVKNITAVLAEILAN